MSILRNFGTFGRRGRASRAAGIVAAGSLLAALGSGCRTGAPPEPYRGVPARAAAVTLKANPVTLLGVLPTVGKPAPEFSAVDAAFRPVTLSSFRGKTVLVSAVPSLDTAVCSLQTRRFNEELARLGDGVAGITISADLPFAQKRFCDAEKITGMTVLSDCVAKEFGLRYGVLMADRGLLSRSVFVIDPVGRLAYAELVPEVTNEPDYDAALAAVRKTAGK